MRADPFDNLENSGSESSARVANGGVASLDIMPMEPASDLLAVRRKKLDALRAEGVAPFGGRFDVDGAIEDIVAAFSEGKATRAAGRITAHRDMGKSHFSTCPTFPGASSSLFIPRKLAMTAFAIFKQLDIGDWIGVEGECFITKTGEPTIRVKRFTVLSKALRPLPEKWHGVQDPETKYRQRYLDLIANPESREIFRKRIAHRPGDPAIPGSTGLSSKSKRR